MGAEGRAAQPLGHLVRALPRGNAAAAGAAEGNGRRRLRGRARHVDLGTPDKPKAFYAENRLDGLGFFHDGKLGVFNALKKESLAFGMPVTLWWTVRGACSVL